MPEMDGYETSRQIRSSAAGDMYKNIPIIAMTANAMLGDRKKCLDAGMSDYLSKPVDSHLLAKKLHKWLIKDVGALTTNNTTSTIEIDDHDYEQPPVENPVWDKAAALKRVRNKPERLQTLIDMYLDGAEQRLQELQQAIDSDDSAQVKHVAHTLKGVAANLGGLQLQTVAAEMELSGSENDIDKSKSLLEDLLHQEQHFREALTEN